MGPLPRYPCRLDPTKDDDGRHRRQGVPRDGQAAFRPLFDLELLADPADELVERCCKTVHRQNDRGAQAPCDLGNAIQRHRISAVDRNHDDVEPPDGREMSIVELVMEMTEMPDAETRNLEDEN